MNTEKPSLSFDNSPIDRLLTVHEVASICGLSVRSIWRLSEKGDMPGPMSIGGSRRWKESELRQWISSGCPKSLNSQPEESK